MGAPAAHAEESKETNPEVEKIRALLKAHDEAMTNQDLKGVMACFTEKAAIMGTGPGEIWVGPGEIKVAYEYLFEGFDKGADCFCGSLASGRARRSWRQLGQAPGSPLRQTQGPLAGSIAEGRYEAVVGSTAVGAEVG